MFLSVYLKYQNNLARQIPGNHKTEEMRVEVRSLRPRTLTFTSRRLVTDWRTRCSQILQKKRTSHTKFYSHPFLKVNIVESHGNGITY